MEPRVGWGQYGSIGVNHSLMLTSYHVRVERKGGKPIKQDPHLCSQESNSVYERKKITKRPG